jgi:hypothetical protein
LLREPIESREQAGQRESDLRSQRAHGDITEAVDGHHQHSERPKLARVDDSPGIDGLFGQQRQDDERGCGEQQAVAHFLVGQNVVDPVVNPGPRREDDGYDDREPRGELRIVQRETAEQYRDEHRDLGRQSRIVPERSQIAERGEGADERGGHQESRQPAELEADGACQRDESEGADAGCGSARSLALVALALDTDQQSDCERGTETND